MFAKQKSSLPALVLVSITTSSLGQWSQLEDMGSLFADMTADLKQDGSLRNFPYQVQAEIDKVRPHLLPSLLVLPKNEHGKLGGPAVRYALHRFFTQHRGWRVQGLDPEGAAWDSAKRLPALERLPMTTQLRLLKRLGDQGLTPEDTLTFAATIGFFIHDEAIDRVKKLLTITGIPDDGAIAPNSAVQAIEMYMACYFMGADLSVTNRSTVEKLYADIEVQYPAWPETRKFLHEVAANLDIKVSNQTVQPGDLIQTGQIFETIADITDRYGTWQNYECIALKKHLVQMEDHGTGRVRLGSFYGDALNGKWQFQESAEYLRELGALDESNPANPRVIIPNYVNGASNCVGTSALGSLCCISECWDLLEHIETTLGSPEPLPTDVARVVAALPSSTVPANRKLESLSLVRLQSIASAHGGVVPLHGRLFAQWLHHIYPRECDFPHRAGTTQPRDLYVMENGGQGHRVLASNEDMTKFSLTTHLRKNAPVETMPWSYEEELLIQQPDYHPVAWVKLQLLATMAAVATMLIGLSRSARLLVRRTVAGSKSKAKATHPVPALLV